MNNYIAKKASIQRKSKQAQAASKASLASASATDEEKRDARKERLSRRGKEERDAKLKAKDGGRRSRSPKPGASHSRGEEERQKRLRNKLNAEDNKPAPNVCESIESPSNQTEGTYGVAATLINEDAEQDEKMKKLEEMENRLNQKMEDLQQRQQQEEQENKSGGVAAEESTNNSRCSKNWKLFLFGGLVVVAIGVGAYFGTRSGDDPSTAPPKAVSTEPPSSGPIDSVPTFSAPTVDACTKMKNGEDVAGQASLESKEFRVTLAMSFNNGGANVLEELKRKIQQVLVPELAGCDIARRLLTGVDLSPLRRRVTRNLNVSDRYGIANGVVRSVTQACGPGGSLAECSEVAVDLELFYSEGFDSEKLVNIVDEVFGTDTLVEDLGLGDSLKSLKKVGSAEAVTITNEPTLAPILQSPAPSPAPTSLKTEAPVPVPTGDGTGSDPTPKPTPFPKPTPSPTKESSNVPTNVPTKTATLPPTQTPPPTSRSDYVRGILANYAPFHEASIDWLASTDSWIPPANAQDSAALWLERYSLAVLYHTLNGSGWTRSNDWLSSKSVCDWAMDNNCGSGPHCNNDGQVTRIELWSNNLVGTIPSSLGYMTALTTLWLADGDLKLGTIPTELGQLTALTFLALKYNSLKGRIPTEILYLPSLKYLELYDNNLTGNIPSAIGGLFSTLSHLDLGSNNMIGTIPTEISSLGELTYLDLGYNNLIGTIPNIRSLSNLKDLWLHDNDLTGGTVSPLLPDSVKGSCCLVDNPGLGNVGRYLLEEFDCDTTDRVKTHCPMNWSDKYDATCEWK